MGDLVTASLSTINIGTTVSIGGGILGGITNSLGITQADEPLDIAMVSICLLGGLGGLTCKKASSDVQVRVLKTE